MNNFNLSLEAQSKLINGALGMIAFFLMFVVCYSAISESYILQLRLAGQHAMALWFFAKCMFGLIILLIITVRLINISTELDRKMKEEQRLMY